MAMKVSVAIATYNRAEMLDECLQSVLLQTARPCEVVVTDDASTDRTASVLAKYNQVHSYRQPNNTGGVPNWNAAMEQTSGDFIAWCSDDDRFLPNHLQASTEYLTHNPHVGLVHSGFVDCLEGSSVKLVPRPLRADAPVLLDRSNWFPYFRRYYNWPFHPSTLVMRREVWERTGPSIGRAHV